MFFNVHIMEERLAMLPISEFWLQSYYFIFRPHMFIYLYHYVPLLCRECKLGKFIYSQSLASIPPSTSKPTNLKQYLHYSSCHISSTKHSISPLFGHPGMANLQSPWWLPHLHYQPHTILPRQRLSFPYPQFSCSQVPQSTHDSNSSSLICLHVKCTKSLVPVENHTFEPKKRKISFKICEYKRICWL